MMNLLKNSKVIGGAVIALAALLLYYFYSQGSAPLLSTAEGTPSPLSQDLLSTLQNLHTIKLDTSIFKDPAYQSLTDFGVSIPPQAAGRRNPFASP